MVCIDTTVLRYVEPGSKGWDGTETADKLVETTYLGKITSYVSSHHGN